MYTDNTQIIEEAIRRAYEVDPRAVAACVLFDAIGMERKEIAVLLGTNRLASVSDWTKRGRAVIRKFLPAKEDLI